MTRKDKMAKKKGRAKGHRSGEAPDDAEGNGQLPGIVDWPGPDRPPLDAEQNDEE